MKRLNVWLAILVLTFILPMIVPEKAMSSPVDQIPWGEISKEELNELLFKAIVKTKYYKTEDVIAVMNEAIRRGASVNARNPVSFTCYETKGSTPLHWVSFIGNEKIAEFLIRKGADVNARDEELGATPLMFAVWGRNLNIVRLLIESGASIKSRDFKGRYAIHYVFPIDTCTSNKDPLPILKFLKDAGLDFNLTDNDGRTVLFYALQSDQCNEKCLNYILDHGARVDVRDKKGNTPLHIAARYSNASKMKLLLERVNSVNEKNKNGDTPLHVAVQRSSVKIVELLLNKGANVLEKNNKGKTPLDFAISQDDKTIVYLLLRHVKDPQIKSEYVEKIFQAGDAYTARLKKLSDKQLIKEFLKEISRVNFNEEKIEALVREIKSRKIAIPSRFRKTKSSSILALICTDDHWREHYNKYVDLINLLYSSGLVDFRNALRRMFPLCYQAYKIADEAGIPLDKKMLANVVCSAAYTGKFSEAARSIDLAVSKGIDLNSRICSSGTPLAVAMLEDNYDVARYLLLKGADFKNNDSQIAFFTFLSDKVVSGKRGAWEFLKFVLENQRDKLSKDFVEKEVIPYLIDCYASTRNDRLKEILELILSEGFYTDYVLSNYQKKSLKRLGIYSLLEKYKKPVVNQNSLENLEEPVNEFAGDFVSFWTAVARRGYIEVEVPDMGWETCQIDINVDYLNDNLQYKDYYFVPIRHIRCENKFAFDVLNALIGSSFKSNKYYHTYYSVTPHSEETYPVIVIDGIYPRSLEIRVCGYYNISSNTCSAKGGWGIHRISFSY